MPAKNTTLTVHRETLVDKIVDLMERRILSGEIPPNTKVSEPQVSNEFNVSRAPAREALNRLEETGLIQKNHLGRRVKLFELEEFRQIYELKNIAEAFCAMQGAIKATGRDHKKLKSLLDQMGDNLNPENKQKRQKLNIQFHNHIVFCSQNSEIIGVYLLQAKKVRWANTFALEVPDRPKQAFEEHRGILNAFTNRDGEKVRFLMENHTNRVKEIILRELEKKKIFT